MTTYRAHEGVEHTDGEGGTAGEGLRHVELRVGVVVVVLVQKLHVRVITCAQWVNYICREFSLSRDSYGI